MLRTTIGSVSLPLLIAGAAVHAGSKVGVVDFERIRAECELSKNTQRLIDEGKTRKRRLDERALRYRQLIEEYRALAASIRDPDTCESCASETRRRAKAVAGEARAIEREKEEDARQRRRAELGAIEILRASRDEKIRAVIRSHAQAHGFDLVFDGGSQDTARFPVVWFSDAAIDISDEIIEDLNASSEDAPCTSAQFQLVDRDGRRGRR